MECCNNRILQIPKPSWERLRQDKRTDGTKWRYSMENCCCNAHRRSFDSVCSGNASSVWHQMALQHGELLLQCTQEILRFGVFGECLKCVAPDGATAWRTAVAMRVGDLSIRCVRGMPQVGGTRWRYSMENCCCNARRRSFDSVCSGNASSGWHQMALQHGELLLQCA